MSTTLTKRPSTFPTVARARRGSWDWLMEPTPRRSQVVGSPQHAAAAERIERTAWRDLVCAAGEHLRERFGIRCEARRGALSVRATGVDNLLFNRTFGLPADADRGLVEAALDGYRDRGIRRFWIHVGPGGRHGRLGRLLGERGVTPFRRSMVKLARPLAEVEQPVATGLEIRAVRRPEALQAGGLLARVFDMHAGAGVLLASLVGREGWSVLGAFSGPTLVAAGALFVAGEVGCLVMSATDPGHRRRGSHQALMAARLREARRRGCRLATTETGEPLSDSDDPSLRNMRRFGFQPVALRESWGPTGLTW